MIDPSGPPAHKLPRSATAASPTASGRPGIDRCHFLARLLARTFDVPMAVATLPDDNRQWVEARVGFDDPSPTPTWLLRPDAFGAGDLLVVEDTQGGGEVPQGLMAPAATPVRFLATAAIRGRRGDLLGALAIMDHRPRRLSQEDATLLEELARQQASDLDLLDIASRHANAQAELRDVRSRLQQAEAKMHLLDLIGAATRGVTDATEVMHITARLLGEHLGATRTAYADVEDDNDRFHIRADWSLPGVSSSKGSYSLSQFGPLAVANLRRGIDLVVGDVDSELGDAGGARMFNAIGIKAIICVGLVKRGNLVAMMAVHQARPRDWSAREIDIVREVVERCWAHIERVRDADKLREQDRRKDEFLATLAHELRNPLAPLRYASEILKRVPAGAAQAMSSREMIDRQIGHMTRLIDDLLDLSRINRGLISLKREPVALRGLLEQAAETVRPQLQQARHVLETRWPDSGVTIVADPTRIVQAVGNLLSNAAKYTPDGGRILLSASTSAERVLIEVTDNGVGIPAEHQPLVFEMFTQLPHSASRAQGGLGIGLALVKTLALLHGGDVRVYSAGIDEGSTFTIDLPLARPEGPAVLANAAAPTDSAAPADIKAPEAAAPRAPGALRVLVVEDNPDGLASLIALLQIMGYETAGASDGPAGLAAAERFAPQVVLLDIGLPGMDGLEVARRLRSSTRGPRMALVALTGWGTDADRARTAAAGFDSHLTKPISAKVLRDVIERHALGSPS